MTDLKIPPSGYRAADGSQWPRHRGKARDKRSNRRRVIAALNKENANALCKLV